MAAFRGGTLLLNWVFYNPVGHVAEGVKVAKGLADANPGTEVSILLNSTAPYELAQACPWIAQVYTADPRDALTPGGAEAALGGVPREWDDLIGDSRVSNTTFPLAPDLAAFHRAADAYFVARRFKGHAYHPPETGAPRYRRDTPIRLPIGPEARAFAAAYPDGSPKIAVLMAGSSPEPIYPSLRWWTRLFRALLAAFPDARLYVTGLSRGDGGRTITHAFKRETLDGVFARFPRAVDCYDIGLANQLALLERCDALVAPHTGFGSLAPCVGTPWVAVSGGRYPEYLFNRVPFYSAVPPCPRYPCYAGMKPACQRRLARGARVLCMDDRPLGRRVPEIVEGVRRVLDPAFTYERAVETYRERVAAAGAARDRFFSWERSVPV
jgi:ADP-heptose:LPS heptosyltransferase